VVCGMGERIRTFLEEEKAGHITAALVGRHCQGWGATLTSTQQQRSRRCVETQPVDTLAGMSHSGACWLVVSLYCVVCLILALIGRPRTLIVDI